MFLQRLAVFSEQNPYYVEGGAFNTFTGDVRMPNCTTYSFLRMQEACEFARKENHLIRPEGGFGNARMWYDTTTLPKGKELREGSIAVFDGTYGHVAVVEKKIDDTHAVISQSSYDKNKKLRNYKYWGKATVELIPGVSSMAGTGKLIGFIYLPINDIRVERNTNKEQVEIVADMVNVRIEPNGSIFCKGLYCPLGIFDVKAKRFDGTYNWYMLEENHWVREGEWLKYYKATVPQDDEKYNELILENQKLLERLRQINKLSEV